MNISYNETNAQIYTNIINLVITYTINNKVYLENDITIILAYTGFIITELFQTFNDTLITTYKFIIIFYLFKPIVCTLNIDNMDTVNIKYVITDPLHRKVRYHRYISEIDDIRRRCTLHLGDASTRMHQHHGYIEGIADIEERCRDLHRQHRYIIETDDISRAEEKMHRRLHHMHRRDASIDDIEWTQVSWLSFPLVMWCPNGHHIKRGCESTSLMLASHLASDIQDASASWLKRRLLRKERYIVASTA